MTKRAFVILLVALFVLVAFSEAQLTGDINGDGKVSMDDVILVANAFGSYPEHARWDEKCDIDTSENSTGVINIGDLMLVISNYGAHT